MRCQAHGSSPCALCCSPLQSTSLLLASSSGQEMNLLQPLPALPSSPPWADGHPHSARGVLQRSAGSYGPLRKKHLCKGNSFPFPSPACHSPAGHLKKLKLAVLGLNKRSFYCSVEGKQLHKLPFVSQGREFLFTGLLERTRGSGS